MTNQSWRLVVNGVAHQLDLPPGIPLLRVLRERLGLFGSKEACNRGECGACTVLIGRHAVCSCVTIAQLVDEPVTTIEGLADAARDLRECFADHGSLQCGFCTPGQIVRAQALLDDSTGEGLADADVRRAMAGNICRCTGYAPIVAGVLAAHRLREGSR